MSSKQKRKGNRNEQGSQDTNNSGNGAQGNGNVFNRPQWNDGVLIFGKTIKGQNLSGRDVEIRVEVRRPEGKDFLRVRVGRPDPRSSDGISRSFWFDDAKLVMEAISDAYAACLKLFVDLVTTRENARAAASERRLRDLIKSDPSDWRNGLLQIEETTAEGMAEATSEPPVEQSSQAALGAADMDAANGVDAVPNERVPDAPPAE